MPIPKGGRIPIRRYMMADFLPAYPCQNDPLNLPTVRDLIKYESCKRQIVDWPPRLCSERECKIELLKEGWSDERK